MVPHVFTKQKIANKLLLILVVPLIVQFVAGFFLFQLVADDDKLRQEERALGGKVETRGRQFAAFSRASMDYFGSQIQQDPRKLRRAEEEFAELEKSAEDENDVDLQKELRTFHNHLADQFIDNLSKPANAIAPATTAEGIGAKYTQAKHFLNEAGVMSKHWSDEMAQDRESLADTRRSENQNRDVLRTTVVVVALVEIAMSIILAIAIIGGVVTSRLSVLVENAYRLPRGLPLEANVKGKDELSYLDETLHEAQAYLKNATEQRSLLMEMIAHDMRSPLMAAQIATDLVSMGRSAPDAMQRNISAVKRNLDTVINLVNDLLTIDRLEAGALELDKSKFHLNTFVDEVIESVEAIAGGKEIALRNETEPDMYVTADKDRIMQVLTNLIANAVKFSPKGSAITISSSDVSAFSRVCVADEGPGLPAGSEKKIFEKFNQVKREHAKAGYGLGLTICKMLVELHGGTIAAQSLPEKGSKFCFSLPRKSSPQ